MKIAQILLGAGLVSGQKKTAEQKFKHLEKVYPQMLDLFFQNSAAHNPKAALRVRKRYTENFATKHNQVETLWNDCPTADIQNTFQRIDFDERFDKTMAKKAFHQITNGYKLMLDALSNSNCPKTNRYAALTDRFNHIASMLKFHYCHKVNPNLDWCKKHRSNPRSLKQN